MADAKSNYLERKNLDHNLGTTTFTKPTNVYIALHTAEPLDDASGAEVATGGGFSYARIVSTFDAAATVGSLSSTTNVGALNWTNLPAVTITHVAIWDASTAGNLLYYGAFTSPRTTTAGDNFSINAGQLTVTEN